MGKGGIEGGRLLMKKTALVAVDYDYNEWEMKYKHPYVIILNCVRLGGIMQTTVEFDASLPTAPIAPGSLWLRAESPTKVIDVHKLIQQVGSQLTFDTFGSQAPLLISGSKFDFISWWSSDQLQIAQDINRTWKWQEFFPDPHWDHEHCFLCYERISQYEDEEHFAYFDGKNWLCQQCHSIYIASGFGAKLGE